VPRGAIEWFDFRTIYDDRTIVCHSRYPVSQRGDLFQQSAARVGSTTGTGSLGGDVACRLAGIMALTVLKPTRWCLINSPGKPCVNPASEIAISRSGMRGPTALFEQLPAEVMPSHGQASTARLSSRKDPGHQS